MIVVGLFVLYAFDAVDLCVHSLFWILVCYWFRCGVMFVWFIVVCVTWFLFDLLFSVVFFALVCFC